MIPLARRLLGRTRAAVARAGAAASNLGVLQREIARAAEPMEAWPAVLYLEASDACNLRCPMCPLTLDMDRITENGGHFKIELLNKLDEPIRHARRIFLSIGGEPMMGPDFFRLIEHVRRLSSESEILFNSNMTYLTEPVARRLIDLEVDHITFSCDGATARTYERIRVGAKFDDVVAKVARLSAMKRELGAERPRIALQMTLMRQNAEEPVLMVELAHRLGIAHVVVEPLTPVFIDYGRYRRFYEKSVAGPEAASRLREAASRAAQLGIGFSSHVLSERPGTHPTQCLQPWMTFMVKSNGEVRPCCGTDRVFGNLTHQDFNEIWNGPAWRGLRDQTHGGRFPLLCANCLSENRAPGFNLDLLAGSVFPS